MRWIRFALVVGFVFARPQDYGNEQPDSAGPIAPQKISGEANAIKAQEELQEPLNLSPPEYVRSDAAPGIPTETFEEALVDTPDSTTGPIEENSNDDHSVSGDVKAIGSNLPAVITENTEEIKTDGTGYGDSGPSEEPTVTTPEEMPAKLETAEEPSDKPEITEENAPESSDLAEENNPGEQSEAAPVESDYGNSVPEGNSELTVEQPSTEEVPVEENVAADSSATASDLTEETTPSDEKEIEAEAVSSPTGELTTRVPEQSGEVVEVHPEATEPAETDESTNEQVVVNSETPEETEESTPEDKPASQPTNTEVPTEEGYGDEEPQTTPETSEMESENPESPEENTSGAAPVDSQDETVEEATTVVPEQTLPEAETKAKDESYVAPQETTTKTLEQPEVQPESPKTENTPEEDHVEQAIGSNLPAMSAEDQTPENAAPEDQEDKSESGTAVVPEAKNVPSEENYGSEQPETVAEETTPEEAATSKEEEGVDMPDLGDRSGDSTPNTETKSEDQNYGEDEAQFAPVAPVPTENVEDNKENGTEAEKAEQPEVMPENPETAERGEESDAADGAEQEVESSDGETSSPETYMTEPSEEPAETIKEEEQTKEAPESETVEEDATATEVEPTAQTEQKEVAVETPVTDADVIEAPVSAPVEEVYGSETPESSGEMAEMSPEAAEPSEDATTEVPVAADAQVEEESPVENKKSTTQAKTSMETVSTEQSPEQPETETVLPVPAVEPHRETEKQPESEKPTEEVVQEKGYVTPLEEAPELAKTSIVESEKPESEQKTSTASEAVPVETPEAEETEPEIMESSGETVSTPEEQPVETPAPAADVTEVAPETTETVSETVPESSGEIGETGSGEEVLAEGSGSDEDAMASVGEGEGSVEEFLTLTTEVSGDVSVPSNAVTQMPLQPVGPAENAPLINGNSIIEEENVEATTRHAPSPPTSMELEEATLAPYSSESRESVGEESGEMERKEESEKAEDKASEVEEKEEDAPKTESETLSGNAVQTEAISPVKEEAYATQQPVEPIQPEMNVAQQPAEPVQQTIDENAAVLEGNEVVEVTESNETAQPQDIPATTAAPVEEMSSTTSDSTSENAVDSEGSIEETANTPLPVQEDSDNTTNYGDSVTDTVKNSPQPEERALNNSDEESTTGKTENEAVAIEKPHDEKEEKPIKWSPYQFDCETEIDDKGDLCQEWAAGGLCELSRPTMFLFCRKTCLCTGPSARK